MAKLLAGGGLSRRRLNKLSCAGWLPHDRGFVSGLPRSRGRASATGRLITGDEDSPPGPPPARRFGTRDVRLRSGLLSPCEFSYPDLPVVPGTIRAIAQMKPTISRAIAVVTTTLAHLRQLGLARGRESRRFPRVGGGPG